MKERAISRFLSSLLLVVVTGGLTPALMAQDADSDGVMDGLDSCTFVPDPGQADSDSDGLGNLCDCGPGCTSNMVALGPVDALSFTSASDFSWTQPVETGGAVLVFDAVRSSDPSNFSSASCIATNSSATLASDAATPLNPFDVFYYLVRAEGSCGGGNLGADSSEARRSAVSCPILPPLTSCTEAMDASCPDSSPSCGGTFTGGGSCFVAGLGACYDTGLRGYAVTNLSPVEINFSADVTTMTVFFAHDTATSGSMRFFDVDNLEVDSPLLTNGDCSPGPMPPRQTVSFSRPVRKVKVTATAGRAWIDTLIIN
jgi:hypothetical protein